MVLEGSNGLQVAAAFALADVIRPESRQAMKQSGKVAWLQANPETVLARMTGDTTTAQRRPDLTNKSALDEIVHLMSEREAIYRETADIELDTEGKSPEELAGEILDRLQGIAQ